jgi:hypothetical protein
MKMLSFGFVGFLGFLTTAALLSAGTASAHDLECEKTIGLVTSTDAGPGGLPVFTATPAAALAVDTYPALVGFRIDVHNVAADPSVIVTASDPFLEALPGTTAFGAELAPGDVLEVGGSATRVVVLPIPSYEACVALGGAQPSFVPPGGDLVCRDDTLENRFVVTHESGSAECRARLVCLPPKEPPPCPAETPTAELVKFWTLERFAIDGNEPIFVDQDLTPTVLAKAKPDECFNGIGQPITKPDANGVCATGVPKVNDAYVWGLTKAGDNLFFGTLANTLCLVESGFLGVETGHVTPLWVCEFGASTSGMGDFRAPNMFRYDLAAKALVPLNPPLYSPADIVRRRTAGLRSAGNLDGVAFLAGPASGGGVSFFAFDAVTGAMLGSPRTLGVEACASETPPAAEDCPSGAAEYTNVRMWAAASGGLYVGVGVLRDGLERGALLRWTGDEAEPYRFVEVGRLPADAANMVVHTDGRIYVTTWPNEEDPAALYRSPVVPEGGLMPADADHPDWSTPLWLATRDGKPEHAGVPSYDPDRVAGFSTGGGALASYEGKIYFGTMHVPFLAARRAEAAHHPPPEDALRTALGTHRSIALFEVDFPAGVPQVSMIVGEKYLPVWEAAANGYTIAYDEAHATGFSPRWAPSGFGNFFNTYTWAMTVFRDQVHVGTFDWSQLARVELETLVLASDRVVPELKEALLEALGPGLRREGADLFRFSSGHVVAESVDGFGNNRNYGVRNMLTDGSTLWVGSANPMNLDPLGGWELIELK